MSELKADTQVIVTIGPVVDKDDALTLITTLDISTADFAILMKHGGTVPVDASGYTWAAVVGGDGYYSLTLPAGGVDTEGSLMVAISDVSLNLQVKQEFEVVAADYWDAKYVNGYVPSNVKYVNDVELQGTGVGGDSMRPA